MDLGFHQPTTGQRQGFGLAHAARQAQPKPDTSLEPPEGFNSPAAELSQTNPLSPHTRSTVGQKKADIRQSNRQHQQAVQAHINTTRETMANEQKIMAKLQADLKQLLHRKRFATSPATAKELNEMETALRFRILGQYFYMQNLSQNILSDYISGTQFNMPLE